MPKSGPFLAKFDIIKTFAAEELVAMALTRVQLASAMRITKYQTFPIRIYRKNDLFKMGQNGVLYGDGQPHQ